MCQELRVIDQRTKQEQVLRETQEIDGKCTCCYRYEHMLHRLLAMALEIPGVDGGGADILLQTTPFGIDALIRPGRGWDGGGGAYG